MRELTIAYGNHCWVKNWVNKTTRYDEIKSRLRVPIRTTESKEEYAKMVKADRDAAKDHGGFVFGSLIGGRRKLNTVASRSGLCYDGDHITRKFLDNFESECPYNAVLYSTHSYTVEEPRVRIAMPATRDMTPEEFVAVSRYVAQQMGIDQFDECSYRPNQLMYYPSVPANGEFVYKETPEDKPWVDPDVILVAHPEWHDPTRLPTSSRESKANTLSRKKVQDPLGKKGIIGLFNRVFYPVQNVLGRFLSDVYEPTDNENRWRLKTSVSMPGVEIIEDKFVYSHHATDPAYLQLCNAFDIVRIHMFGDEADSNKAMREFAAEQDEVKLLLAQEKAAESGADFGVAEEDIEWRKRLEYETRGSETVLRNTLKNLRLILENDPNLKAIMFNKLADGLEIRGEVPWQHPARFWRDQDDAQLISYIDDLYGTFSQRNYDIAVTKVADDRSYHPIREMFAALPPWDGMRRVETVLIDYLGAQDTPYVRAVTRKALCAAYMRVHYPGIKFDYIIVLNGAQGIGKSTLIAKLGMEWFSDSLSLLDMNDKTAAEKLQGYWIHEISEMAGMRKADLEKVKAFVSRQDDKYRASFGRRVTPHPRQCIFFGTTNNENGYLRDITGNRRFWNVKVFGNGKYHPWQLDDKTIKQIWAEAKVLAEVGEPLFLSADLEDYAKKEQRDAMEQDERVGLVQDYLDIPLPDTWDSMSLYDRRDYIHNPSAPTRPAGKNLRQTVSNIEIWCECFSKSKEDMRPMDSNSIASIMAHIDGWDKSCKSLRLPIYGKQRYYIRK